MKKALFLLGISWLCRPDNSCEYSIQNQIIYGGDCKKDSDCSDISPICTKLNPRYLCEYIIGSVTINQNNLVDKPSDCPKISEVCSGVPRYKCTYHHPMTPEASEIVNNCSACKETQATICEKLTSTEYQCKVNGVKVKTTGEATLTEQSSLATEYQCKYNLGTESGPSYQDGNRVQNCSDCPSFKGGCVWTPSQY